MNWFKKLKFSFRKNIVSIKKSSLKKWVLIGAGSAFVVGLIVAISFFFMVRGGFFGPLPSYGDLETIQNNIASELYSEDGKLIGKYFIQERTHTALDNISPHLIDALIATEDVRFYEHSGIDYKSLGRVVIKSILLQDESAGGGSTLSQQLAKNLFPRKSHGILTMPIIKLKEAIIAHRLENIYSKEEILELYLNTVSFGDNAFGIETAAERYFDRDPDDLTIPQSAMLVGMLKATYNYNPRVNPKSAIARRNLVLEQMAKYGYLPNETADSLKKTALDLNYVNQSHSEGIAAYFREHLRIELSQLLKNKQKSNGENYNLYTDGLKIYTTIDSRIQKHAEAAVHEHMAELQKVFNKHWGSNGPWNRNNNIINIAINRSEQYKKLKAQGLTEEEIDVEFKKVKPIKVFSWDGEVEKEMSLLDSIKHYLNFLNSGFLVMDTHSGDVKAWVGGINHKYFKYDHVNKNTKRQVGSTFKPIVYAAAIEQGMDPCNYRLNQHRVYEEYDDWSPKNSDGIYEGYYSMQGALTHSINTVSVDLIMESGIKNAVNTAQSMGITSTLEPVPALALGSASVSLMEMVASYCTFGNNGRTVSPRYITKIEDKSGAVIHEVEQTSGKRAISEYTAEIMVSMMQNVVNHGTAGRLRYRYGLYNDIAGKTGTSQNHADGWFIGVTPNLTAGVWVGASDPRIHFRSLELGQGASTALPIYGLFMQRLSKDPELKPLLNASFPAPSPEVIAALDCEPYIPSVEEEPKIIQIFEDLFKKKEQENLPKRQAPKYPPKKEQKKKRNLFERIFGGR